LRCNWRQKQSSDQKVARNHCQPCYCKCRGRGLGLSS
jgi:hypothetical protein